MDTLNILSIIALIINNIKLHFSYKWNVVDNDYNFIFYINAQKVRKNQFKITTPNSYKNIAR